MNFNEKFRQFVTWRDTLQLLCESYAFKYRTWNITNRHIILMEFPSKQNLTI